MCLVFRSSCREGFWENKFFENNTLYLRQQKFLQKMMKRYLWNLYACNLTKMLNFSSFFSRISTCFFLRTPQSNCAFIFLKFHFRWDIGFSCFRVFLFFFFEKTLDWIFSKCKSLILYVIYQCSHVFCKLAKIKNKE